MSSQHEINFGDTIYAPQMTYDKVIQNVADKFDPDKIIKYIDVHQCIIICLRAVPMSKRNLLN